MSKVNRNGVQADFDEAEAVIQRATGLFSNPAVNSGLIPAVAQAVRFTTDFYPPVRKSRPAFRFATAKQRRWFWWAVKKALVLVPYRRTRNLAKATTLEPVEVTARGFTLAVTVDRRIAPYAQYVIGPRQLPGHQDTGWPLLYRYVRDQVPGLAKQVGAAYGRTLRGYFKGGRP